MRHVYLAPHLDDAVLSCGGAIHQATTAGETVLVITVFAGEAKEEPLSPFALVQHGHWGKLLRPMALRRAEDAAALTLLGAECLHLDYLDAVYRADSGGQWLYTDLETLLGAIHPADPLAGDGIQDLADHLARVMPADDRAVLCAPLGVGRHVDHQIVHAAARQLLDRGYPLAFYVDYPYAERPGAVEIALAAAGAEGWRRQDISLAAVDIAAKVSALSYYHSQLPVLFDGGQAMPNRIWSFAAQAGLGEQIWWPQ